MMSLSLDEPRPIDSRGRASPPGEASSGELSGEYTVGSIVAAGVVRPSEAGAQPEVCEFDVSAAVDENVVRLDVAVYEAHPVHAVDRQNQFGDEELRQLFVEDSESDEQTHQITARYVVHDEVQMRRVLHPNRLNSIQFI